MRIPNHLDDLHKKFPTIEPLERYIRQEYCRFATMTLEETKELRRHGELFKLYVSRQRKTRKAQEQRETAARIRVGV